MPRPPNLTYEQRSVLARWEPILKQSAKSGELHTAETALAKIQASLRKTGHETRLMANKVWFFEAAMESGHLDHAVSGLIGIRGKVRRRTLTHRKATALLAICYIRMRQPALAEPLISEALRDKSYSGDRGRRADIRQQLALMFQEESLISELRGRYRDPMDSDDLLERAGHLVQSQHEAEILEYLGNALPLEARERFSDMVEFTRKELPSADRKLLPSAQAARASSTLGQRTLSAMKRVIWQSLCDKESAVYQAWSDKGLVYIVRLKFVAGCEIMMQPFVV